MFINRKNMQVSCPVLVFSETIQSDLKLGNCCNSIFWGNKEKRRIGGVWSDYENIYNTGTTHLPDSYFTHHHPNADASDLCGLIQRMKNGITKIIILFFTLLFFSFFSIMPAEAKNVYNVTDYMAYPDNGKDDTREFQKVLDFAKENKEGITVIVPEGEYNLSGTLDIYSNTHVVFENGARIITTGGDVFRGAHTDRAGNPCSNLYESCPHGMYSQTRNVILEGGEVSSTGRDDTSSCGYIVFSHAKNILIKGMTISGNCSHAIRFYGCKDVTVKNCSVENNYATKGRRDAGAFESIQLGDNCIDASDGYPYPHDDSKTVNTAILNCRFKNVITGIGNHANCPMADQVLIKGCLFQNVGGNRGNSPSNGSGYGIDLSTISHSVIKDNFFFMNENSFAGIMGTLWGSGTSVGHLIENNFVFTKGRYGIFLDEGATALIKNNILMSRKTQNRYRTAKIHVTSSASALIEKNIY